MSEALGTLGYTKTGTLGNLGYVEEGVIVENPVNPAANNLFFKADLFVNAKRNQVALVPIVYKRNNTSLAISATPAMTVFRYVDRNRISQRKQSRDYIINVTDLIFNEVAVRPEEGDIIIEDTERERFTYEVGAWNGEPLWLYSGAYRQGFRIHTKLIDREDI